MCKSGPDLWSLKTDKYLQQVIFPIGIRLLLWEPSGTGESKLIYTWQSRSPNTPWKRLLFIAGPTSELLHAQGEPSSPSIFLQFAFSRLVSEMEIPRRGMRKFLRFFFFLLLSVWWRFSFRFSTVLINYDVAGRRFIFVL